MTGRRSVVVAAIAVVVVLVVLALVGRDDSRVTGPSLSPASVGGDGTKAMVLLLQRFGATARVGDSLPRSDDRVALVLRDRFSDAEHDQVRAWVAAGGTLVDADPTSDLTEAAVADVNATTLVRATCDIAGLDGVDQLSLGPVDDGPDASNGSLYRVGDGSRQCFGGDGHAYIVQVPHGLGSIISIGGANPFTNARLDESDNAVLVTDLLLAHGSTVAIIDPNRAGRGTTPLIDLLPTRVVEAVLQLLVAFVVYALWRARRLGKPIVEHQPVAIAGSRLVDAVGRLYQRTGSLAQAAHDLRVELRRLLSQRYGLAAGAPPELIAEVVAARTGLDRDRVRWAVGDWPIPDEATLVQLAAELDAIRQEVLHVHR